MRSFGNFLQKGAPPGSFVASKLLAVGYVIEKHSPQKYYPEDHKRRE